MILCKTSQSKTFLKLNGLSNIFFKYEVKVRFKSTSQGLSKVGQHFELIIFSIVITLQNFFLNLNLCCANGIDNFFSATEIIGKGILNISVLKYVSLAYYVYAMIYPTEHELTMR